VWHSVQALGTTEFLGRGGAKCSALTCAARRDAETAVANRVGGALVHEARNGTGLVVAQIRVSFLVVAGHFFMLIASSIQNFGHFRCVERLALLGAGELLGARGILQNRLVPAVWGVLAGLRVGGSGLLLSKRVGTIS
jgi:hypothetical protein